MAFQQGRRLPRRSMLANAAVGRQSLFVCCDVTVTCKLQRKDREMKHAIAFLAALLLAPFAGLAAADQTKPNIILVMPDDVGYGDYACLGNPIMRTPSVDAFKKQSLLFTQFHVSPTCSPTRSALMSGRHEFKNGVTHTILERERMSLKTFTLPQMLKSRRLHHRHLRQVASRRRGGVSPGEPRLRRSLYPRRRRHRADLSRLLRRCAGQHEHRPRALAQRQVREDQGLLHRLVFRPGDQVDGWRSEQAKQPFFAYIPLNAAHGPHVVPEEYYQQYLGKPGVNEETAKFFGMIENIDTNFGALLAKLKEWGIEDNTLVIYFGSDNGGTAGTKIFNAGMHGGKGTPYQGGTRAPCFFRWPAGGIPAGAECDALSAHIDIFPTLAEITGAKLSDEVKQQVEGRSLLPLLKNPKAEWADRTLVHHVGRWANGQGGGVQVRQVRDSELALHAGEQRGTLRPQGRPRRNQERHRRASRGGRRSCAPPTTNGGRTCNRSS